MKCRHKFIITSGTPYHLRYKCIKCPYIRWVEVWSRANALIDKMRLGLTNNIPEATQ